MATHKLRICPIGGRFCCSHALSDTAYSVNTILSIPTRVVLFYLPFVKMARARVFVCSHTRLVMRLATISDTATHNLRSALLHCLNQMHFVSLAHCQTLHSLQQDFSRVRYHSQHADAFVMSAPYSTRRGYIFVPSYCI